MNVFSPIQLLKSHQQTQAIEGSTTSNNLSDQAKNFNTSYGLSMKSGPLALATTMPRASQAATHNMGLDLSEFGITSLPANLSQIDPKARMIDVSAPSHRYPSLPQTTQMVVANLSDRDKAAIAQDMVNLYGTSSKEGTPEGSAAFLYGNSQLEELKYSIEKDKALRQVSAQFEALLIQQMLKGMRSATHAMSDQDNPLSHSKDSMFQDMMDNQLATSLSRNSRFGLADSLYAQLSKIQG